MVLVQVLRRLHGVGFRGTALLSLRRRACLLQALHGPSGDPVRTKNAKAFTKAEDAHVELVKLCPCSVCGRAAPSEAHHINQGDHFTTVALCTDCHRGSENGWHGRRTMWRIYKIDELGALNETIRNVLLLLSTRGIR
ncbi:hypothetical protein [Stenotrophomonas maltophilia]|uniref:hypothetical protein n=1 Tax=Stenotrophomonas maltophilia TaxID=40324 RepID=UPI0021550045|nr:hypothetical protein [Stenotrophomonas maltophilia]